MAIDAVTQENIAEISSAAPLDDGRVFPDIFHQVSRSIKTVIGDGAYDDQDIRDLIRKRGGKAFIPPPSNAVCHGKDPDRDCAVLDTRALKGDLIAKSL